MKRALFALLLAVPLSGCSLQKMVADNMVPVFAETKDDFNRGTIVSYARQAAPGLIATLNGMVLSSPSNPELRLLQAEMNATFAFAFLEKEDPVWASFHYRIAREAALAALADEDRELAKGLPTMGPDAIESRVAALDAGALPALFWWGFARGSEINLNKGDPGEVAHLGKVEAVMDWVVKTDETFFNGGPHLFFAMRHVALPASLGGNPKKGLHHFEAVDRITGNKMLMSKVLRAQYYAPNLAATPAGAKLDQMVAAQKAAWKAYFDTLDAVVKAPADLWPEQALSNAVAKKRALALLKDPESNNINPPKDAKNPYAGSDDSEGSGWEGDDDDDDDGDWGD